MSKTKNLFLIAGSLLLISCAESTPDFCKYLSLDEARSFDPSIVASEMRQTRGLLYCVWGDGLSDKLFISLDRKMNYEPVDFLKVVAQNSPEKVKKVISLSQAGNLAAALFLGDNGSIELEFLIAQDSRYSITIRAPGIESGDSEKLDKLKEIADAVLPRI